MTHINLESSRNEDGHLSASSNGSSYDTESCENKEANGGVAWEWDDDPYNPYNWPTRFKIQQVIMMASAAFTT
jgi:hypothetical protein